MVRLLKSAQSSERMRTNLAIIDGAGDDIGVVVRKVRDNLLTIIGRGLTRDPVLVPIADLGAEENADDDDPKIDRDCKPVVMRNMLARSAKNHFSLPRERLTADRNGTLTKVREAAFTREA